jgi:MFS family permease
MSKLFKPSIISALVSAFSSFGDAFLYIALPVNAVEMNVPVIWIGFLLAINRFVRLIGNQLFGYLFNRYGFKRITSVAALFAALTTLSYGLGYGLASLVIARVVWGFCYSALRISNISYSLQNKKQGFSLGLSKGLQELGPIIAWLAGPVLLYYTSIETTFIMLALASVTAIMLSFYLPELKQIPVKYSLSFNIRPSPFDLLTFLSAFFVQGILIVSITQLLIKEGGSLVAFTALAGIYLAYRQVCTIFISPFGGHFADKFGLNIVYLSSLLGTIIGLFLIAVGFTRTGILIVFTFSNITAALAPAKAMGGIANLLKTVAINSTWSDLGAGAGALIAGSFLVVSQLNTVFYIGTFILLIACSSYIRSVKFKLQPFKI